MGFPARVPPPPPLWEPSQLAASWAVHPDSGLCAPTLRSRGPAGPGAGDPEHSSAGGGQVALSGQDTVTPLHCLQPLGTGPVLTSP